MLKPSDVESVGTDGGADAAYFAYNVKGLMANTRYSVRVATLNEAGWSPVSTQFQFTTSQTGTTSFKHFQARNVIYVDAVRRR